MKCDSLLAAFNFTPSCSLVIQGLEFTPTSEQSSSLITSQIWGTSVAAGDLYPPQCQKEPTQCIRATLCGEISALLTDLCMCDFLQNSNSENPNCVGIEEVLEAYFQSLRKVQLYGPTNFAPVINQVAR